ncbi:MAG: peptidylprolyl isomerase [Spirochaetes bacterium]|nr:peptidylprolyl isomerase [Spirochaetota bacterium]
MVQVGNFVAIHYTGRLDNGEVFDSCTGEVPFEFEVGAGTVIEGLDKAVRGMEINEEKHIVIPPEEAYGLYNDAMVQPIPIEEVRKYFEPKTGMVIGVQLESGVQVPATIKEVSETTVLLDFNHQLAGKTLHFDIKIMDINDEPKYSSGCLGHGDDCESGCSC